jgi:hypothetical protein
MRPISILPLRAGASEGDCDDVVECLDECANAYNDCTVPCDETDDYALLFALDTGR